MKLSLGKSVLLSLALGVFIFVSFLGLSLGMTMKSDGVIKPDCPFMSNTASVCKMSPLEHIAMWQSVFTTLPLKEKILLTFGLLAFALALFLLVRFFQRLLKYQNLFYLERYRYLQKIFIPHSLQELYSSGILNPKIF
jgi:hypothetical protein